MCSYNILDRCGITRLRSKIVKKLSDTLSAITIASEGINNPNLTQMNSGCKCCRLRVTRNKFHILNATTLDVVRTGIKTG
jgi:hypothetical protein